MINHSLARKLSTFLRISVNAILLVYSGFASRATLRQIIIWGHARAINNIYVYLMNTYFTCIVYLHIRFDVYVFDLISERHRTTATIIRTSSMKPMKKIQQSAISPFPLAKHRKAMQINNDITWGHTDTGASRELLPGNPNTHACTQTVMCVHQDAGRALIECAAHCERTKDAKPCPVRKGALILIRITDETLPPCNAAKINDER